MSLKTYQKYLIQQYNFYNNTRPRSRSDSDFPFQMIYDNRLWMIKKQLRKIPFLLSLFLFTYRSLKGISVQNLHENWLQTNILQLYDVRCMLNDELSRVLFDNAIILRLVTFEKYFFPKPHFDEMITVLSEEPFLDSEFPHDYLGLPLYQYESIIKGIPNETTLKFIAPNNFISLFNSYRQYLITRNSFTFSPEVGDVVFDCGACIGDMATIFAGFVGGKGEVHIFDPIPLHARFCKLQSLLNPKLTDVYHINTLAIGDKTFKVNKGSRIDSNTIAPGGIAINQYDTTSLDDYVSSNSFSRVDFIKMDVEGAEADAIKGAQHILEKYKPKLAISTYHKPDDFWSIPLQIKNINPDYKFMFGHHSPLQWESVIYAY